MTRDEMILNNQGLIGYTIKKLGLISLYDDLYDLGLIGLIKAVDTYDEKRKIAFASYAYMCIRNEMLMIFRKKRPLTISLETQVTDNLTLEDAIKDNYDLEEDIMKKDEWNRICDSINNLNDKERELIIKYFGLFDSRKYTQLELSKIYNHGQTYINRLIKKAIKKLRLAVNR